MLLHVPDPGAAPSTFVTTHPVDKAFSDAAVNARKLLELFDYLSQNKAMVGSGIMSE